MLPEDSEQPQQLVLHRLPAHALVLASHSEYFKAALSQRWNKERPGKVCVLSCMLFAERKLSTHD
jgi:hypothetical protein